MKRIPARPAHAGSWFGAMLARLSGAGLSGRLVGFLSALAPLVVLVAACAATLHPAVAAAQEPQAASRSDGRDGHDRNAQALVLGEVAVSAWDDGRTVGAQFEILNRTAQPVKDVRLTAVTIEGGWYQGPAPLPRALGKIQGGAGLLVDAIFRLSPINGCPHAFTLVGTYVQGGKTIRFKLTGVIKPTTAEPGPFAVVSGQSVKKSLRKSVFPPSPPRRAENNAEMPIFIPLGPQRQLFPLTPTVTDAASVAGASVEIVRNTTLATNAGVPPDPNAAASAPNGVVLSTFNTGISFSTDGGVTFTNINLFAPQPGNAARTTFFPESDGGLCCDQVVVYIPGRNLFVWLLQYQPVLNAAGTAITSPNRLRIAWATPQAIAADFYGAWTYADLTGARIAGTSDGMGVASTEWMDYPDLAWSDTFLYVGVDHGSRPGRVFPGRRIVARMRLADIADDSVPTVRYNRSELTGSSGLNKTHFVQGAPGRMVVGSLDNSSTLRIFTFADNAGSPTPSTVPISSITRGTSYTSLAPDGTDWLAVSFPGNITGAAFRRLPAENQEGFRDEYLFAFDAGVNAGAGRARAYVRLETVTPQASTSTRYSAFAEYDVWNSNFAFAMAALGSDGREIGMTLAVGGGTIGYPQEAVGYRGDFVVYVVTASDATQTTRFGDYFSNRLVPGGRRLFGTEVYDVILNPLPPGVPSGTCATVGCTARARYVLYGRPQVIP